MTNDQCEAIIKAIAVGFESLLNSGVRQWQKIGDDTSDAASRTAAIAALEAEFQAIISALPDENP